MGAFVFARSNHFTLTHFAFSLIFVNLRNIRGDLFAVTDGNCLRLKNSRNLVCAIYIVFFVKF